MNLSMNLLENSYDYIYNALDFYHIADEYGTHDPQRSNIENKKKWKTSFILLVQAIELLIKESLYKISPCLVFENIDVPVSENSKTVSFNNSINRVSNFYNNVLSLEEIQFIKKCASIRNDYIHYEVKISTPELKHKFCKLYELYKKIHIKGLKKEFVLKNDFYKKLDIEINNFSENLTVFRGDEIKKTRLIELKEEIEQNKKNCYYLDKKGNLIPRIVFGLENDVFLKNGKADFISMSFSDFDYCGDCLAKKGEYHLDGCDWEICPVCLNQKLSCDCDIELCDKDKNIFYSPYAMN